MQEKLQLSGETTKGEEAQDLTRYRYKCLEILYNIYFEGFYSNKKYAYNQEKPLQCLMGQCYALGKAHRENLGKIISKKQFIDEGYAD